MQGTNEQSRYISVPAAFQFITEKCAGMSTMRRYNTALATEAANQLVHMWKTRLLVPHHLSAPFLRVILTPIDFRPFLAIFQSKEALKAAGFGEATRPRDLDSHVALKLASNDNQLNEAVAQAIFKDTGIQGQFFLWVVNGTARLYCRISAQVYNTLEDYNALGEAVLRLCAATKV
jgi:selenocysteine lyase/cysteine desulfurase